MATTTSSRTTPELPVPRTADWLVVALVLMALLLAWIIRQQTLFATQPVQFEGIQLSLPAGTLPLDEADQFAVTTTDGLTVRINRMPAPPVGTQDTLALAANRSLEQARTLTMYRVIANEPATVAEHTGSMLEYAYVQDDSTSLSPAGLTVIHGYELLLPLDNQVYTIALEASEMQWNEVQAFWPRLLASLRLS